jgi:hypothetical protein
MSRSPVLLQADIRLKSASSLGLMTTWEDKGGRWGGGGLLRRQQRPLTHPQNGSRGRLPPARLRQAARGKWAGRGRRPTCLTCCSRPPAARIWRTFLKYSTDADCSKLMPTCGGRGQRICARQAPGTPRSRRAQPREPAGAASAALARAAPPRCCEQRLAAHPASATSLHHRGGLPLRGQRRGCAKKPAPPLPLPRPPPQLNSGRSPTAAGPPAPGPAPASPKPPRA